MRRTVEGEHTQHGAGFGRELVAHSDTGLEESGMLGHHCNRMSEHIPGTDSGRFHERGFEMKPGKE